MVGMPHMITKGPELSVLDHHYCLKGGGAERIRILNWLEAKQADGTTPLNRVSGEGTLATINLDGVVGLPQPGPVRVAAFDQSWFGYDQAGAPQNQNHGQWTGWWKSWHGNAEEICREALIRAIRLSLGMNRDVGPDGAAQLGQVVHDPPLNISFRWACGAPTFEAYIEWDMGPIAPHVIVTFSTPANDEKLWLNFDSTDAAAIAHGYDFDPNAPNGSKGVWLVAHRTTHEIIEPGIAVPVDGELDLNSPVSWLSGSDGVSFSPIVTVDIPEPRGGIDNPPRTWA